MERVYRSCNWILAGLLVLLGFSACGDDVSAPEYGCPYVRFTVKGKVTNETKEVVPGVKVKITEFYTEKDGTRYAIHADSTKTNTSGNYEFLSEYNTSYPFELTFEDIDGAQNGLLKSDTVFVSEEDLKNVEFKGGSGWFQGAGEMTIDVTLKEQEEKED